MKNFIGTLALATMFVFGLSSFARAESLEIENAALTAGCDDYATAAMEFEVFSNYPKLYDNGDYAEGWLYYYYDCMN